MTEQVAAAVAETKRNVAALEAPAPEPEGGWPDFPAMGIEPDGADSRELKRQHFERLSNEQRDRIADLEHRLRRSEAAVKDAYERGRRDERMLTAKTHGGRLPSILRGGR